MRNTRTLLISVSIILLTVSCSTQPGEMEQPVEHRPGDTQPPLITPTIPANAQRGEVFISDAQLLVMESYPVQVQLRISGELPTPCHQFRADVAEADGNKEIHVQVYSLVDPEIMCVQVMEPFEEGVAIPMQGQADGEYSVWLNGDLVGEFSYPG